MGPLIEMGGGTLEYRFRHRDGHYVWIQDTFKVMHDEAGQLEIVGSWADISYHKQAQQALGDRMAVMKDLQALVGASPSVIYTTQTSGDFACRFVSDNLKSIMAYAPWEMVDDPSFWVKHLHPEDSARVLADVARLIGEGGGRCNIGSGIAGDTMSGSRTLSRSRSTRAANPKRSSALGPISRSEARRGGVAAPRRAGGEAQPTHSRDVRPIPDR